MHSCDIYILFIRVDKGWKHVCDSISSAYHSSLRSYRRVQDLLDEVRVIEDRKKDVSHRYPRQQRWQAPKPWSGNRPQPEKER